MKIIAGKYKNRVINTSKKFNYRPSTTKFKEALFSILSSGEFYESNPVKNAKILDLFAGTGSLSFEALSRGAKSATLVDNSLDHLNLAKEFAEKLGEENNVKILLADARELALSPSEKYNLVFIDPPYYNNYVEKSLQNLVSSGYLEDGAIIVIEIEKIGIQTDLSFLLLIPDSSKKGARLELIKEKIYGKNKLIILRYEQK